MCRHSVTVLTAETIARARLFTADDFAQLTPGVTIMTGTAEAGDTQINIHRLNGARDAGPSVALVVDGILKTNTAQLNQRQGSLRQIEVLKGPQGALHGRNAAAGAIAIQTLRPTEQLSGGVRCTDRFRTNRFPEAQVVDDQQVRSLDGRLVREIDDSTGLDIKSRHADLSGASITFNASFHLPKFAAVNPDFHEDVNEHPFGCCGNNRPTNDQTSFEVPARLEHQFETAKMTARALCSRIDRSLAADGTSADFAR